MQEATTGPAAVDAYIAQFPDEVQVLLRQVRAVIREAAPDAAERIGYGMPGFYQNGSLVWYAGFKRHIGFYPKGSSAIEAFQPELSGYKTSKGAIQFPLDHPLPLDLIRRMVQYRLAQNLQGAK